jgi:hypothetical protein
MLLSQNGGLTIIQATSIAIWWLSRKAHGFVWVFLSPGQNCTCVWLEYSGSLEVQVSGEDDEGVLELFETDVKDVRIAGDLFFPLVKADSKGIRVRVMS